MILTRQIEYEFEHLCLESHTASPCACYTFSKLACKKLIQNKERNHKFHLFLV